MVDDLVYDVVAMFGDEAALLCTSVLMVGPSMTEYHISAHVHLDVRKVRVALAFLLDNGLVTCTQGSTKIPREWAFDRQCALHSIREKCLRIKGSMELKECQGERWECPCCKSAYDLLQLMEQIAEGKERLQCPLDNHDLVSTAGVSDDEDAKTVRTLLHRVESELNEEK